MRSANVLLPVGLLLLAESAFGSCTSVLHSQRNTSFETVAVVAGSGGAASMQATINQGIGQWNTCACVTYLNPVPFPRFTTSASPGVPVITIHRHTGFRSAQNVSVCGEFLGPLDGSSGTINVYTMGRQADGTVYSCGLDDPSSGGDLIAHELGHYLNLDNSDCGPDSTAIMGPAFLINVDGHLQAGPSRRVLNSECSLVDFMSFTPSEEEERDCRRDPEPCTGTSPILIDLDNNRFHLAWGPVFFDIDADGEEEAIAWTRPDQLDAFLCYDRNGNGRIDDGSELFGDSTPMAAGHTAANGYIALAELDEGYGGNFDGQITFDDALFGELCLWLDRNHNGYSEPEELLSLDDAGIVAIGLEFREWKGQDAIGNHFPFLGVAWKLDEANRLKRLLTTDVFFTSYE